MRKQFIAAIGIQGDKEREFKKVVLFILERHDYRGARLRGNRGGHGLG